MEHGNLGHMRMKERISPWTLLRLEMTQSRSTPSIRARDTKRQFPLRRESLRTFVVLDALVERSLDQPGFLRCFALQRTLTSASSPNFLRGSRQPYEQALSEQSLATRPCPPIVEQHAPDAQRVGSLQTDPDDEERSPNTSW